MAKIKLLDKSVYNKIAAGEVVEKPSSIVKELVENSIDAGASKITIDIKHGGILNITVIDNGCGIENEDVEKAFMPHATSKIDSADDLYNLRTLGFRGEALASISAVSQMTMITKTENEELGTKIEIEGGEITNKTLTASTTGTYISVSNLFYNIPARAKFLRKPKTEENDITFIIEKIMLSNPSIGFKYVVDDKTIYNTTGGVLFDTVYTIYGDITENLIPINLSKNGYIMEGFISRPEFCKPNRTYQTLMVNGRYVQNSMVSTAIQNGYESFIMKGKFPFYVINFKMPLDLVDVNVHPNKLEIKFENSQHIFGLFNSIVYKCLYEANHIIDVKFNNASQESLNSEKLEEEIKSDNKIANEKIEKNDESNGVSFTTQTELFKKINKYKDFQFASSFNLDNIDLSAENTKTEKPDAIYETQTQESIKEIVSDFSIIGVAFETYIIIQRNDKLLLIDQHAGHERQLYDNLMKQIESNSVVSQNLLVPYVINVNQVEADFIKNNIVLLNNYGFSIDEFGRNCFRVDSVPYILSEIDLKKYFDSILADCDRVAKKPIHYINEYFTQRACKAAVKAGKVLTKQEITILLENFDKSNNVLLCPHGRPIIICLTKNELEKLFKRTL